MISAVALRWILLLLYSSLSHQTSSDQFTVKVQSEVSGRLGSSVSLHCALDNNMDARPLEVRWHCPEQNTPVLLYKNRQIQKSRVDVRYQGRAFLLGDLEKGDVSLKLENLMLGDSGDYVCHVKNDVWYDKATVSLRVRAVGSTSVISLKEAGEGQVNISCKSHGWFPEPSIIWTDKEGRDLKHLSTDIFTTKPEGTVDVSSWLIVSPSESEWISCSVGLSDPERKDSRVTLFVPAGGRESLNGYFIAMPILLLCAAAGVAVFFLLRKKGLILSKKKGAKEPGTPSETEPLNMAHVENQDQNEDTSDGPVLHAVVVESRGEQRGTSSFSFSGFSTDGSATDKPNLTESFSDLRPDTSNTTPTAIRSNTTPTAIPSNTTPTAIPSNTTPTTMTPDPTPAAPTSDSASVTTSAGSFSSGKTHPTTNTDRRILQAKRRRRKDAANKTGNSSGKAEGGETITESSSKRKRKQTPESPRTTKCLYKEEGEREDSEVGVDEPVPEDVEMKTETGTGMEYNDSCPEDVEMKTETGTGMENHGSCPEDVEMKTETGTGMEYNDSCPEENGMQCD
ncbi:mucin-5B-like isoform X2 [Hemibagrus wyckioides]|uniref:mucin-5B-like isoform X2 n=1 Tax=Hemibagrus wyckioides TaxID=337641 RepID=UPI00266C5495|nr:mucin-5B-like isoform X2 [Hemibagrus wyckioides]